MFQMPEANDRTPADPPGDDTFEMRFWTEEDLRQHLEAANFEWLECRRFEAGLPEMRYNQLRIHGKRPQ